jgi:hypothetical protein
VVRDLGAVRMLPLCRASQPSADVSLLRRQTFTLWYATDHTATIFRVNCCNYIMFSNSTMHLAENFGPYLQTDVTARRYAVTVGWQ